MINGLWVRTQDNSSLVFINDFSIKYDTTIVGSNSNKVITLGNYQTKELTLKILDLIHRYLFNMIQSNTTGIFNMPSDNYDISWIEGYDEI